MPYATEVKVESMMAQFALDGTTSPDSTQVAAIITDVDAELDVVLAAQGVTTPVTAPADFLSWVTGIASIGVTARVLRSAFPDVTGPGEQPAYRYWQKLYDTALAGIKDGSMIPPTVSAGGAISPSTYFIRNPDAEEDLGDIAEPKFKMAKDY